MNEKEQYRKLWKERLKDFDKSGLTIKAWCKENQLKVHQFYYWRKKFNAEQTPSITLVPIDLTQMNNQTIQDSTMKIHVGSINLEIHSGFNPSQLKEVMKVLMEIC